MSLYNMLAGQNPMTGLILYMIGVDYHAIPRFRDTWLHKENDEWVGVIHTRSGGGNRECYCGQWGDAELDEDGHEGGCMNVMNHELTQLPNYRWDEDDEFDCTYANFYFTIPAEHQELAAELATAPGQTETASDRWAKILAALEKDK